MDNKNKNQTDKDKSNKFQSLLDKLASKDLLNYTKDRSNTILLMDLEKYSKLSMVDRKTYVLNQINSKKKLNPIFMNLILILVESLKINNASLLILEDLSELLYKMQEITKKNNGLKRNLERFAAINIDPNEPRFTLKEYNDLIFEHGRKLTNNYLYQIGKNINERIFEENKQNINQIRYKYHDLKQKLLVKVKYAFIKANQTYPNLSFQQKVDKFLTEQKFNIKKIWKNTANGKIYTGFGIYKSICKKIDRFLTNIYTVSPEINYTDFFTSNLVDELINEEERKKLETNPDIYLNHDTNINIIKLSDVISIKENDNIINSNNITDNFDILNNMNKNSYDKQTDMETNNEINIK